MHLELSLSLAELLGGESAEVGVESINSGAALFKSNDDAGVAVGADDNDGTLLLVDTHLGVSGVGSVGDLAVPAVVGVDVVAVAGEERGEVARDLDIGALGTDDGAQREELAVGVVLLEVRDGVDVGAGVGRVERVLAGHVGGKVLEGLGGGTELAGEDKDAESTVERDLLLEVDDVGINDAGHVGVHEETAGDELGGGGVDNVRLGGVRLGPVEGVGLVEDSVSGSESARLLESLDELVLLGLASSGGGVGGGGSDIAGAGGTLREELGVLVVEGQEGLGNILALGLVGLEDLAVGEASLNGVNLPGKVEGIEESSVHALASLGAVGVASITTEEDAVVESVLVRDTLANGVDGEPLEVLPLDGVGLEDLLGGSLDLLGGGGLAGVEVGIGGRGDLDVETDHVVLTGDDHDGAVLRVDGALHLDIGEVGLDNTVHDTPHEGDGVLVLDANLELVTDEGAGTLTTEKVLGADGLLGSAVKVSELDLDGVLRVGLLIRGEAGDGPGALDLGAVLLEVGNEDALDHALVEQGGEGVTGINEFGARGPGAGTDDALALGRRVPESDLVDTSGLVGHDAGLETHVAEEIERARLNAIGTARLGGLRPVVDVLDLVTPSGQASGQHQADGASANDD